MKDMDMWGGNGYTAVGYVPGTILGGELTLRIDSIGIGEEGAIFAVRLPYEVEKDKGVIRISSEEFLNALTYTGFEYGIPEGTKFYLPAIGIVGFLISALGIGAGVYLPDIMLFVGGVTIFGTVIAGLYDLRRAG